MADAIGEADEAERLRLFLRELDRKCVGPGPLGAATKGVVFGDLDDDDRQAVGVADPHLEEAPRFALRRVDDVDAGGGQLRVDFGQVRHL